MGFFENLGRKVGEFTQEAKETAAREAPYVCEDCSERFYTERAECPACGSENVIERETSSDAAADESASDGDGVDGADRSGGDGFDTSEDEGSGGAGNDASESE